MQKRIVSIQHGDYSDGLRRLRAGEPEHHFGVGHALQSLADLFGGDPHLVISLNSRPYRITDQAGEYVGLPQPDLPRGVPRTVGMLIWAQSVLAKLEEFRPTHVLLRTGDVLGVRVLRYCIAKRLNTLACFAFHLAPTKLQGRFVARRLCHLLNDPCVYLVGNHTAPATQSLVRWGLNPNKAVAWDWPATRRPRTYPAKTLDPAKPVRISYVGLLAKHKGVGDLIEAAALLHKEGRQVRLTIAGAGPDADSLSAMAAAQPTGLVDVVHVTDSQIAFQLMLDSTVVCLPSRHGFAEGMPLTLSSALASRTPVVLSDHPVFREYLRDGEGVRICAASSPRSLAETIASVVDFDAQYTRLSSGTMEAFQRIQSPTTFGDLLKRWAATF